MNRYQLKAAVADKQTELSALLQHLIRIRSYSGEEQEIIEFIIAKMQEYKFDEVFIDGLGNAVGRIGSGPLTILFDAHIDTVKVTADENWQYPPFEGRIVNGKIYGRGAVDEKPAMAGFLMAGKILKEKFEDKELPFTLYVVGSVLEEDLDGYPLLHLIENEGIRPDYVLLGEPTDLHVYHGQRGRMEIDISVLGKSAHGAHNRQGINAIYKMAPLLHEIEKLDEKLQPVEPLGKGSITVSQIASRGPSLCSVPDFCGIHIDRRMTVNEDRQVVLDQLHQIIQKTSTPAHIQVPELTAHSWKGTLAKQEAYFPTWLFEADHPLVQAGMQAAEVVLGKRHESATWSFSTNGVATAGRLGIPTIGFAPGKEELSHTDREELVLDDLLKAAQFYTLFPFELAGMVK